MAASFAQAFSGANGSASALTVSVTAAAGSNRKLLVCGWWEGGASFTTMTYAGSSTGVVSAGAQVTNGVDKLRRFYIDETTLQAGANDVVFTISTANNIRLGIIQLNDAAQGSLDNQATATPTTTTAIEASLTPTVDNCMCTVFVMGGSGSASSDNAGQTRRISIAAASPRAYASTEAQTTATADNFGYTWSASASGVVWASSVAGAAASGDVLIQGMQHLDRGMVTQTASRLGGVMEG